MSSEELISKDAVSRGLKLQKLKLASLAPLIIKALKLEKVKQFKAIQRRLIK